MSLLLALDLVGTFVFAISGASAGVTRRLDLFRHPRSLFRGRKRGWHYPRRADRIGSTRRDQRLAVFGCLAPCRRDHLLLIF
jgi:hypothetical protein